MVRTMLLVDLIKGLEDCKIEGDPQVEVRGLAYDSRRVKPGYLFLAIKGHSKDGHQFIGEALERGATTVVIQYDADQERWAKDWKKAQAIVKVKDSREALSRLSLNFYRPDFNKLTLVGITGTNGKTTTSYLMESILKEAGKEPGVIGTVNYRFKGLVKEAPVTTPESLELMEILREMNHRGITHVIMEVSSHALEQGRVEGCPFKVRVFTNISRDHLDYHGTMEAYFQAKAKLFNSKEGDGADRSVGIINVDLPEGKRLVSIIDIPWLGFGLSEYAHVRAQDIHATKDGIRFRLITPKGETEIRSSLLGTFNIYNILAASGAALALGIGLNQIQRGIEKIKLVPGRMEPVSNNRGLFIVVDYAHTPDALSKVLETLRPLVSGRIITVFGCGGDRDKGKRDLMGKVAAQGSDMVIITSDNPRTEDPMGIIRAIEQGIKESGSKTPYQIFEDRRQAIQMAIEVAKPDDLILIAGKGHEHYQIIGTTAREFDDRKVARDLASLNKSRADLNVESSRPSAEGHRGDKKDAAQVG